MPTVVKRGDRYLARVRKTGFNPVSQSFIRKADALTWGRRVEADMQAGRYLEAHEPAPSLKNAIIEYRAKVAVNLKGARSYGYSLNDLEASSIGAKRVDQLKPADLAAWRDALAGRGLMPSTVARRLGLLSGVLTWCHKEKGWLTDNPMRSVRKPTVRDARTRTLDTDEVRYLNVATAAARAAWLPDVVSVLIWTAMRRSEVIGLRCCDVDFVRSIATLSDSKNGESREVPLCPEAKAAMQRLTDAAAVSGREALLPIADPEAISFAFRRAVVRGRARYEEDCAAEGRTCKPGFLTGVRLHDLRHHSISLWARTGGLGVIELMKISGHKSPRTLIRYAHLDSEQLAAKMATLATA
jgi:integrase